MHAAIDASPCHSQPVRDCHPSDLKRPLFDGRIERLPHLVLNVLLHLPELPSRSVWYGEARSIGQRNKPALRSRAGCHARHHSGTHRDKCSGCRRLALCAHDETRALRGTCCRNAARLCIRIACKRRSVAERVRGACVMSWRWRHCELALGAHSPFHDGACRSGCCSWCNAACHARH